MGFLLKTRKLQDSIFLSKGGNFSTIFSSFPSISHFQSKRFYCSHTDDEEKPENIKGMLKWYYSNPFQTVPYSNRTRRVLLPYHTERSMGEKNFKGMKEYMKKEGMLLPLTNPDFVRVNMVFNSIIAALQRDLKKMRNGRVPAPFTSHLDELDWEVLVVNCPCLRCSSVCFPGGKIAVTHEVVGTDIEIATIISHEVAHIVARHQAERVSMIMMISSLNSILGESFTKYIGKRIESVIPRLPFNGRLEFEADYIGLLLLASAGYDPQLVPEVHEKMKKFDKFDNAAMGGAYLYRHPPGSKRAIALARAKIMDEALARYNDARAGRIEHSN